MHAHVEVQRIKKLTLDNDCGQRVTARLEWTRQGPRRLQQGYADVIVDGVAVGSLSDFGLNYDTADGRLMATRYLRMRGLGQVCLSTNDLLEAVAFAVAGPNGWDNALPARMGWYLSDAESRENELLDVAGVGHDAMVTACEPVTNER